MADYGARVAIKRYVNGYVLAYAIYDNETGGVVLADNCSVKNFYSKKFWDYVYRDLKAARRMESAGHKLEPLWGHISDRGTWEYRGEDYCEF